MSNKIYRTALGKQVDMGSLLSKNETVRAVGNMNVNARGDTYDKNEITTSRASTVNDHYRKQIRNQIVDVPVENTLSTKNTPNKDETIEGLDTPLAVNVPEETDIAKTPRNKKDAPEAKGGLASAIAKAREVEQKKLQTPREQSRSKKGVKKI